MKSSDVKEANRLLSGTNYSFSLVGNMDGEVAARLFQFSQNEFAHLSTFQYGVCKDVKSMLELAESLSEIGRETFAELHHKGLVGLFAKRSAAEGLSGAAAGRNLMGAIGRHHIAREIDDAGAADFFDKALAMSPVELVKPLRVFRSLTPEEYERDRFFFLFQDGSLVILSTEGARWYPELPCFLDDLPAKATGDDTLIAGFCDLLEYVYGQLNASLWLKSRGLSRHTDGVCDACRTEIGMGL
jgi:hypothetical protein